MNEQLANIKFVEEVEKPDRKSMARDSSQSKHDRYVKNVINICTYIHLIYTEYIKNKSFKEGPNKRMQYLE